MKALDDLGFPAPQVA